MDAPPRPTKPRRTRAEVDAIVDEIGELFVTGGYVRGVTDRTLATKYGVSLSMIQQWAVQASRKYAPRDEGAIEAQRAATISTLVRIARKAEVWASAPGGDQRLLREATTAIVKAAEIGGVTFAPPAVAVNVLVQNGELGPDARAFVGRAASAFVESAREVLGEQPELLARLLEGVERRMTAPQLGPGTPAAEVVDAEWTAEGPEPAEAIDDTTPTERGEP